MTQALYPFAVPRSLPEPLRLVVLGATGSIGIAASQPPHLAFDDLLSQADAACFTAKELGGNLVLNIFHSLDTGTCATSVGGARTPCAPTSAMSRTCWCSPPSWA